MKIKIHYQDIQETVEVRDAADALSRLKAEAAKRAPFLLRGVVKGMSDSGFAAEAVKRANGMSGRKDPVPATAQQFLDWAVARGYATIIEP